MTEVGGQAGSRPVVLVTGAARRVGRAVARRFAVGGFDAVITYRASRDEAESARRELSALGAQVIVQRLDLADLVEVERTAALLAGSLPRLDVLVHNASGYDRSPLGGLTGEQVMAAYRVNAAAPAVLSAHLAPVLGRSSLEGGGSIVAMCDVHAMGEHGLPRAKDFLAYAMSKAALSELVRSLARELAPGVRVNGVAPGVVAWPESGHESDAGAQAVYLKRVPLARAGTAEDAAETVWWLATGARYVTGEIVRVDGGRSLM